MKTCFMNSLALSAIFISAQVQGSAIAPTSTEPTINIVEEKIYGNWPIVVQGQGASFQFTTKRKISGFDIKDLKTTFEPLEKDMEKPVLDQWQTLQTEIKAGKPLIRFDQNGNFVSSPLDIFLATVSRQDHSSPVYKALSETLTGLNKELTLVIKVYGENGGEYMVKYISYQALKVGSGFFIDGSLNMKLVGEEIYFGRLKYLDFDVISATLKNI